MLWLNPHLRLRTPSLPSTHSVDSLVNLWQLPKWCDWVVSMLWHIAFIKDATSICIPSHMLFYCDRWRFFPGTCASLCNRLTNQTWQKALLKLGHKMRPDLWSCLPLEPSQRAVRKPRPHGETTWNFSGPHSQLNFQLRASANPQTLVGMRLQMISPQPLSLPTTLQTL